MSERNADSEVDLTDRSGYHRWTTITIRYRDQDPLKHVNNSVYSEWFEVARVALTESLSAPGPDWLVTSLGRMTINFLAETTFPGEVQVGARLISIGNRSFRSGLAVFRDDRCLATADCISVYFDPRIRSSVTPPPEVRAAMEQELAS